MRGTHLMAGSFAGAACLLALAAPAALAEPAAEVSPRHAAPGATVTISVSCDPDPDGDEPPPSITASSQAFAKGTAVLKLVPNEDDAVAGPAYNGTARLAGAAHFSGKGPDGVGRKSSWGIDGTCPDGADWNTSITVDRRPSGGSHAGQGGTSGGADAAAVAAGGVLLAGAVGWGVQLLLRREHAGY